MADSRAKTTPASEVFALALSGGGSRAMAFHLGCLRALNQAKLLEKVSTISSVSGGSVLAALYCHHDGDFDSFEKEVRSILARGFFWPALRIAFTTTEGIKALVCVLPLALDRFAAFLARLLLCLPAPKVIRNVAWLREPWLRRWASRTTILRRVFSELFGADKLTKLRTDRPKLIMVACELQDKSAFYFASEAVGSWRLGAADPSKVEIAQAVVASAAYPGLLPALDDCMTFVKNGKSAKSRIILTDGGVYDNLGLSPLWPDRDPKISLHVDKHDRIVACRAGYGLRKAPPSIFWPSRMLAVLYTASCAAAMNGHALPSRVIGAWRAARIRKKIILEFRVAARGKEYTDDRRDGPTPPPGSLSWKGHTGGDNDQVDRCRIWVDRRNLRTGNVARAASSLCDDVRPPPCPPRSGHRQLKTKEPDQALAQSGFDFLCNSIVKHGRKFRHARLGHHASKL